MRFTTDQIEGFGVSPLAAFSSWLPWELTGQSARAVEQLLPGLKGEYDVAGNIAVHRTATVEGGSVLKGPAIIGPRCLLAT